MFLCPYCRPKPSSGVYNKEGSPNKEYPTLGKTELLVILLNMLDTDAKWNAIENVIRNPMSGMSQEEKMMTLAEVSKMVCMDRTWLYRLGVRQACGRKVAGRLRYRISDVKAWLSSDECGERASELGRERKLQRRRVQAA